jgi:AhpD family alkylhydroperoxidase
LTEMKHDRYIDWPQFQNEAPDVVAALRAVGKAVEESGLEKALTELVKLRASQLNGCAFCLQLHLSIARKLGIAPAKLDLLATWRDAGLFSPRERAALAWTEALTLIAVHPVPDSVYAELQAQFSEGEVSFLTASIGVINAWNRIAGGLQFAPSIPADRLIEGAPA